MNAIENCKPYQYWGSHMILNCKGGDKDKVKDKEHIRAFVDELVEKIKMEKHGDAIIEHFGAGNLAGITLVQLIKTSSIVFHFCDETGDAYGDVFSCKPFDAGVVLDVIQKYFSFKMVQNMKFDRGV